MRRVMLMHVSCVLSLVSCVQDAGLTALKEPEPSMGDTSAPPEEELEVDTDAPDPVCPDPGLVPASVGLRQEDCRNEPLQRTFRPEVEWSMGRDAPFATFPDHYSTTTHPSVGHVTDDNGDGVVGPGDIPDIASTFWDGGDFCRGTSWNSQVLRLVSGDGSGEHWSVSEIPGHPGWEVGNYATAMGDINGDGKATA